MIATPPPDRAIERGRLATDAANKVAAPLYAGTALAFATTVVATRLLGPADYGLATLAIGYPLLLWSFMSVKPITMAMRLMATSVMARGYGEGPEDGRQGNAD